MHAANGRLALVLLAAGAGLVTSPNSVGAPSLLAPGDGLSVVLDLDGFSAATLAMLPREAQMRNATSLDGPLEATLGGVRGR